MTLSSVSLPVAPNSPLCQIVPVLVSVENTGCKVVYVCARADEKQQDQEQGLEVEQGRLWGLSVARGKQKQESQFTILSSGRPLGLSAEEDVRWSC